MDNSEKMDVNQEAISSSFLSYFLNPWIILVLVGLAFWSKNQLEKFRAAQRQHSESAAYHKDPDLLIARQEAMEVARRKMQEKYDQQAQVFAEKQKEKAEAKRREIIEEWEKHQAGRGYKSKVRTTESSNELTQPSSKPANKPKLKPDYNPLMGDGGASCSFRPGRRGPSAGG